MHTPLPSDALLDALKTLWDLLEAEPEAGLRPTSTCCSGSASTLPCCTLAVASNARVSGIGHTKGPAHFHMGHGGRIFSVAVTATGQQQRRIFSALFHDHDAVVDRQ